MLTKWNTAETSFLYIVLKMPYYYAIQQYHKINYQNGPYIMHLLNIKPLDSQVYKILDKASLAWFLQVCLCEF